MPVKPAASLRLLSSESLSLESLTSESLSLAIFPYPGGVSPLA